MLTAAYRRPATGFTALALDDDPARRWFKYEAEVDSPRGSPGVKGLGIFFGWQGGGPGEASAYFVQVLERPKTVPAAPAASVRVGRLRLRPAENDNQGPVLSLEELAARPLREVKLERQANRYRLGVDTRPGRITLTVNDEYPVHFAPPPGADPRGPLGIWVQGGQAIFGRASVTVFKGDNPAP